MKTSKKESAIRIHITRPVISALSYLALLLSSGLALADEQSTAAELERIQEDPIALRQFLYRLPKGGNLHTHLGGNVYAEYFLLWAAEDGKCIDLKAHSIRLPPCDAGADRPLASEVIDDPDLVNQLIDAMSVRNYQRREVSGHNQFFATFARFQTGMSGREGDVIAKVTARAARQQNYYVEMMQSNGMFEAIDFAKRHSDINVARSNRELLDHPALRLILQKAIEDTDDMESQWRETHRCETKDADLGCDVSVRYLAQVIRTFPRDEVLAQTVLAVNLIAADPRYVGLSFVAPEDNLISLRDFTWQMEIVKRLTDTLPEEKRNVMMHAGELAIGMVPPDHLGKHVREAVEIAGARRIGHGTDIGYDPNMAQLMTFMADSNIAVEVSLTSSDVILGITGDDHPFDTYRRYGVPLTLSTDDEGVSRVDLTYEYQRAVETYDLSYPDLKAISRNGLASSFLPGNSLFLQTMPATMVSECRGADPEVPIEDSTCRQFLQNSDKAQAQWALEERFARFESRYD